MHSNHSGTSATTGAKVLILPGRRLCPSTSRNSIDKNLTVGNPRNCRHAYAIFHGGRCCKPCSARLAMKLQINLMSMTLYKCWSICSPTLTEPPWTMAELRHAISRLKSKKNGDDLGLAAELLKHSPDDSLNALLLVMKEVFPSGHVPSSWQRAFFNMLPETKAAKSVSELRPMANVRLLYKLFAYLMFGRMEDAIEASQPDEQHGFRRGRRIEEHFLTADVRLQKTLAAKTPLWIIDLDLAELVHSIWRSKFSTMLYLLGRKVNEHRAVAECQGYVHLLLQHWFEDRADKWFRQQTGHFPRPFSGSTAPANTSLGRYHHTHPDSQQ